ncbi:MAG: hypothetical protein MSA82_09550 [Oscillospiraceae bacterium]|nr:hypothetical protein [Oscillospiraceae bacterium]
MTDFSDKYKKALEYQELSPDFKERTAKLMAELRDADAPVPKTADENDNTVSPVIVSENGGAKTDRSKFIKIISTAAAAAACLTVAFALNRAGVLDKDSGTSLAAADSISTEVTDLIEGEEQEEETPTEAEYDIATYDIATDEAVDVIPEETTAATEAEIPAETTPVSAYTTPMTTEATTVYTEEAVTEAKKDSAPPDAYAVAGNVKGTAPAVSEEEDFPLETVLILEPLSEDMGEEIPAEANEIIDEEADDEAPVNDDTGIPNAARSSAFSPQTAVSEFPAQNTTAVITPSFEDIDPENGNVVTYEPRQVRSVSKLIALNKELFDFSDSEASYSSEAPADSRYIIDYTDKQGNALRIYMGSRYICFAKDGYYTFELTEEEYNDLDSTLFGLIS